jgi:hypothetical protein
MAPFVSIYVTDELMQKIASGRGDHPNARTGRTMSSAKLAMERGQPIGTGSLTRAASSCGKVSLLQVSSPLKTRRTFPND